MDSKKIANNILEFLVNPRVYPVEKRLYFRSEEILDNSYYEDAIADADKAYGDQSQNSSFYPTRNRSSKREASFMDRKTLIASMDVLSQKFNEKDPIAKDLRTMAYAISKMSDEELQTRLNVAAETFKCPECGTKVLKQTGYCVKCKKKVEKGGKGKKAAEEETKEAEEYLNDNWSKEASDIVSQALVYDILGEKASGKKKGPGVPDGTGPWGGTSKCQMNKAEDKEEEKEDKKEAAGCNKSESEEKDEKEEKSAGKDYETERGRQPQEEGDIEEKHKKSELAEKDEPEEKEAAKKKGPGGHTPDGTGPHGKGMGPGEGKGDGSGLQEEDKEAKEVDTNMLATIDVDGIQLENRMIAMDDVGDLSEDEQNRLSQLFQ